ncbi:MAG: hypothetical protein WBA01_13975 [Phormidesmis sp.]
MFDSFYSQEAFTNLRQAYFKVKRFLKLYALLQDASPQKLPLETSVFSSDQGAAGQNLQSLMHQLRAGNFSALPEIEIVSRALLMGARSQYIAEKHRIYLASDFVKEAAENVLVTVLLQEMIAAIRSLTSQTALDLDSHGGPLL